jgi:hypothetical protein
MRESSTEKMRDYPRSTRACNARAIEFHASDSFSKVDECLRISAVPDEERGRE